MPLLEISSVDQLRDLVKRVHCEITAARREIAAQYTARGEATPSRIGFDELTFPELIDDMLTVMREVHRGRPYYNKLAKAEQQMARLVAFAGVCQYIKDEYADVFWSGFSRRTGSYADNRIYNTLWAPTFKDEGAELIYSSGVRHFIQSFIQETGIPRRRHRDTIAFFRLYWRHLRSGTFDLRHLIASLISGKISLDHVPPKERDEIYRIARKAEDYPEPFARVIDKLSRVFDHIEQDPEILPGNIDEHIDAIRKATGVDPLSILGNAEQLRQLLLEVIGLVTPEKLTRLLELRLKGQPLVTPEGKRTSVGSYTEIMYGKHEIDGVAFCCVPSLAYTVNDLANMKEDAIRRDGDSVLLRSRAEIKLWINDRRSEEHVRKLFHNGNFMGYLAFVELRPALSIFLSTANGAISEEFSGQDGVHAVVRLKYSWNPKLEPPHRLAVDIPRFDIKVSSLAGERLLLLSDASSEPVLGMYLEENGCGYSAGSKEIDSPTPSDIRLRLCTDEKQDKPVTCAGSPVEYRLRLDDAMLFSTYFGTAIPETGAVREARFGGERLTLFVKQAQNESAVSFVNFESNSISYGGYDVYSLKWQDRHAPASIEALVGDRICIWRFRRCLHAELRVTRIEEPVVDGFTLDQRQGTSVWNFALNVCPSPSPDFANGLCWVVMVNDERPVRVGFTSAPGGTLQQGDLVLGPADVAELLRLAGRSVNDLAAKVEIGLAATDTETIFDQATFWIFPHLAIEAPASFVEGSRVSAALLTDQSGTARDIVLQSPDDGCVATLHVEHTASHGATFREQPKMFAAEAEVPDLGTSLKVHMTVHVVGARLYNKDSQEFEPLHSIARREFNPLILVVSNPSADDGHILVNDSAVLRVAPADVTAIPLAGIDGIDKAKNTVTVEVGRYSAAFEVTYGVAVSEVTIVRHLQDGCIVGTITFSGPVGSSLSFIAEERTTGKRVGALELTCGGRDQTLPIRIDATEASEDLTVELYLPGESGTVRYGRRWSVSREPPEDTSIESADALYETACAAFKNGRYFETQRLLKAALEASPNTPESWLALLRNTERCILDATVFSIGEQAADILRKEYKLDV